MPSPQQARAQASAITSGKTAPEAEAPRPPSSGRSSTGPRLSPGQRRIAQYLIEHITEAAFLSITDLAERVGVSQPSVTRFAAAVGFSGYPALREKLQSIALGALAGGPGAAEENARQRAPGGGRRRDREPGEPAARLRRPGPGDRRRPPAVAVDAADHPGAAHLRLARRVLRLRGPPHPPGRAAGDAGRQRRLRRAAAVPGGGRDLGAGVLDAPARAGDAHGRTGRAQRRAARSR